MTHHMRRKDRAITDPARIGAILNAGRYCTFGLVDGDEPYVFTLSYGYDGCGSRMYCHAAREGRKLDIIRRNPLGCGTVILDHGYTPGECEHPFESVVMDGRFRILEDTEEKRHALQVLVGQLEPDSATFWEDENLDDDAQMNRFTGLCFEITSMTAKAGK